MSWPIPPQRPGRLWKASSRGSRRMGAHVIDGKALAADLKERLAAEVEALINAGARPGLATVMAGYDGAVEAYERRAHRPDHELYFNFNFGGPPKGTEKEGIL